MAVRETGVTSGQRLAPGRSRYPAQPRLLFVVRPLVEVDQTITERLALKDNSLGGARGLIGRSCG